MYTKLVAALRAIRAEFTAPLNPHRERVHYIFLQSRTPGVPAIEMATTERGIYVRIDDAANATGPDRVRLRNVMRTIGSEADTDASDTQK